MHSDAPFTMILIVELCALLEERKREVMVIGLISQTLVTAVIFLQCFDVVTDCVVRKVMQSVVFIGPFPLFFFVTNRLLSVIFACVWLMAIAHWGFGLRSVQKCVCCTSTFCNVP